MEIIFDNVLISIDEDDLDLLLKRTYKYDKHTNTIRSSGSIKNKNVAYYLHRDIMNIQPGDKIEVDHINRNTLDNRKVNLRLATRAQNSQNRGPKKNKITSKFVGVSFCNKKWRAVVRHKNKSIHVGYFKDEIEAAKARDKIAYIEYGSFAYLNFPLTESSVVFKHFNSVLCRGNITF